VSTRVHSRYRRRLADLPVAGRPVEVWLAMRRFFCDHVDCSAGTFVEQVIDSLPAGGVRASVLDSFKPYLCHLSQYLVLAHFA
jgi:hypothetical protein